MSVTTRTGDKGMTGLYGGERVPKDSPRIHACGIVDELNAVIGLALAESDLPEGMRLQLLRLQHSLFRAGGDLATPLDQHPKEERIGEEHSQEIEAWIESLERELPPQTRFLLPSGSRPSALLHLARTVCRRAERHVVAAEKCEKMNPHVRVYLNRLSDCLFLMARKANRESGRMEIEVDYGKL